MVVCWHGEAGDGSGHARDAVTAGDACLVLPPETDVISPLEASLIRGFRRLPDEDSRAAFLDVLEDSIFY